MKRPFSLHSVNQAITDLALAKESYAASQMAEQTAKRVLEAEETLFELARSDSADLLNAQRFWTGQNGAFWRVS